MKPKKVPKAEAKDGQVEKLRNRIRKLTKQVDELKSEVRTYKSAWKDTGEFLRDHTENISLEKLVKAANGNKSLKDVQEESQCPSCGSDNVKLIPTNQEGRTVVLCSDCGFRKVVNEKSEEKEESQEEV
jgi:predicted RNA-binding Zn-ribbon protein involved in translation (DUF1610 family)